MSSLIRLSVAYANSSAVSLNLVVRSQSSRCQCPLANNSNAGGASPVSSTSKLRVNATSCSERARASETSQSPVVMFVFVPGRRSIALAGRNILGHNSCATQSPVEHLAEHRQPTHSHEQVEQSSHDAQKHSQLVQLGLVTTNREFESTLRARSP